MRKLLLLPLAILVACSSESPPVPGGGTGGMLGEAGAGGDEGAGGGSGGEGVGGTGGGGGEGGEGGEGGALAIGLDSRPANATCKALPPVGTTIWNVERIFPALSFDSPIYFTQAPGGDVHAYVVEQRGRIRRFDVTDATSSTIALDITTRVRCCGETGLLGFAFHPDFQQNGEAFLSYTTTIDGAIWSRIARIHSTDGGATFEDDEEVLLELRQPYSNHNGGMIAFGPDGYLYIAFGDGGSGGDPDEHGQNTTVLLGKILRIDPDGGTPYAIPPTNPFFGSPTDHEEIFAWGFRNPWRFSFDRLTGQLWAGDVGQGAQEEVDIVVGGGNYGWNLKEGTLCFSVSPCGGLDLVEPVLTYGRDQGQSITGGYVYRGSDLPDLQGAYVFADYVSGRIWKGLPDGNGGWKRTLLVESGLQIPSFGEMNDGELVIVHHGGTLHRLIPADFDGPPPLLSLTGCFDADDPTRPAEGLVPFEVNVPFWSDGGEKQRWLAIPDGETISVGASGHLDFPAGSVLVKEFRVGSRRVETRLLSRGEDGSWSGVSYAWREDGSDAEVVPAGTTIELEHQSWIVPGAADCMRCHVPAAGDALGTEIRQLNRLANYGDREGDQLATLAHVGLLEMASDPRELEALPAAPDAPLADRARAWLHSNCSFCHRPGGPGLGPADFRFGASDTGVCDTAPQHGSFGIDDARLVAPGDPSRSVLSHRVRIRGGPGQMPPLATNVVDEAGAELLDDWIRSLAACP